MIGKKIVLRCMGASLFASSLAVTGMAVATMTPAEAFLLPCPSQ